MPNETVQKYAEKKNALERLDILEATVMSLIQSANGQFTRLDQQTGKRLAEADARLMNLAELIDAVVVTAGVEKVEAELAIIKERNYAGRVQVDQSFVDENLLTGKLSVATEVKETSFLVLEEYKDGKPTKYPRFQFPFVNLIPSARKDILGKGVGAKTEVAPGRGFEVKEIYDINPDKEEAKTPEPPPAEAQTEAGGPFQTPPSELLPPSVIQGPPPEAN